MDLRDRAKLGGMMGENPAHPQLPRVRVGNVQPKVKPTVSQLREAAVAGRAYALTREGEWNPYQGGNIGLLARVWKWNYQAAMDERRESDARPAVLDTEME